MTRRKGSAAWAKYKDERRRRRQNVSYAPNPNYRKLFAPESDTDRIQLVAPKKFSILTNRDEVIRYLKRVAEHVRQRDYAVINMRDITSTDLATIAIVISMMMDERAEEGLMRKYMNVYIPPPHTNPGRLFMEAQFHQTVTKEGIADHTFFLSRRSNEVNIEYIADVLKYARSFLGEDNVEYLSPIMVEVMQNTNNHANPDGTEDSENIPWFLAVHENAETGVMTFTIVDLGIGIFESLKLKNLADTSKLFDDAITDMYGNSQSKFLSVNIPKGVDSSTGLAYRGKGLKTVHALANKGNYGTFKVVTNRALIDVLNTSKVAIDSSESISGTVFYWEMDKNGRI